MVALIRSLKLVPHILTHMATGVSDDSDVNALMASIKPDVDSRISTMTPLIFHKELDEESIIASVIEGVSTYLEDGVTYNSFVDSVALIKKNLLILLDNESSDVCIQKFGARLTHLFFVLKINPYDEIKEIIWRKRFEALVEYSLPFIIGFFTGTIATKFFC